MNLHDIPGIKRVPLSPWAALEESGSYVSWSPDGRLIAIPLGQRGVRIVDVESNTELATLGVPAKNAYVNRVAWSPDGSMLAGGCGPIGTHVWTIDIREGTMLGPQPDWVGEVAWARNAGGLADGSQDGVIRIWDFNNLRRPRALPGKSGSVNCLAWSPNDSVLASGTADGTVELWSPATEERRPEYWHAGDVVTCLAWSPDGRTLVAGMVQGRVVCVIPNSVDLEGHTDDIVDVAFSADGRILCTASRDRTVRLWRTDKWTTVAVLQSPAESSQPMIAFHPQLNRFAVWTKRAGLQLHDYDLEVLLNLQAEDSVRYMTAKVVLVGDSGVGKTGLGWRLAHGEFKEHASTHGQQFWTLDQVRTKLPDGTDCEAVLWDLAGQHVYRPVHAIFLNNVDLALVLFDPTNRQEPLKGVKFWLHQLASGGTPPPSVLVGARLDRGSTVTSQAELDQFCQAHQITGGYVSTSAATGAGLDRLTELVRTQIPWERMTTTVTTVTFKRIKEFVLALKEQPDRDEVLVAPADLRTLLEASDPQWRFTDAEMMTAVGHLENHGYVAVLRTSAGARTILLTPELLVDLASSIFLEADQRPDELGALNEADLLAGRYPLAELVRLSAAERQVLLDAAVVRFLEHNLCFRDELGADTLLIFPGLIKHKRPLYDAIETVDDVTYVVRGRVENVYAALVVLLGHTPTFTRVNHWHHQALLEMGAGQICGFRLIQEREGEIELVLYYSDAVPRYGRSMFQGLFESFLYQRDVTVTAYPPVVCANGDRQDRSAVIGSMREGMRVMFCSRCGDRIPLPDHDRPSALGAEESRLVERDGAAAKLRATYEAHLVRVKRFRSDRAVPRCYLSHRPADAPWAAQLARDLREAGVLVVDEPRDDDVILAVVTPGYVASPPDSELIRAHRSAAVDGRPGAVPLLRSGAVRPGELNGLVAGEFQDDTRYVVSLFDLVLTLYAIPFDHPAFDALRTTLRATWNRHLVEHAPATEVYLSYSWTEGSNTVADELDAAFQARGVTVVRDRRDAGYRASIGEFMERIGRGRCVVLVISDAYLRSPNCLFELLRIARHGEFADRVFPVVLPDAAIHRPQDRIGYVRHWEQQISELDEAVRSVSSANLHGFRDDIDLYTEIRAQVPRLAEILADMNTLTVDLHRDGGFAQLIDAVLTRLDK